jgi:catechol 2,3-dioxygenase-like lactoylglutathione lyase family enzyme
MFKDTKAFSGFAVNDLAAAKAFYGQTLGLEVDEGGPGLRLKITGGSSILIYPKETHTPANYTILNFPVDDIDAAVKGLAAKGVTLEHYEGMTDEQGIARGIAAKRGPDISWFKDPAGNVLAVLQEG